MSRPASVYVLRQQLSAILGVEVSQLYHHEAREKQPWDKKATPEHITVDIEGDVSLTVLKMRAVAELFKTEDIDFYFDRGHPGAYSEVTPGDPAEFTLKIYNPGIPIDWPPPESDGDAEGT